MSLVSHPNRLNKHKFKKGSGCKMCKPHKGKWAHFFKKREREQVKFETGASR